MPRTRTHAETVARARSLASTGIAREIRLAAGLSLREMAASVGCSASALHRYENGRARVSEDIAARFVRVLDGLCEGAAR